MYKKSISWIYWEGFVNSPFKYNFSKGSYESVSLTFINSYDWSRFVYLFRSGIPLWKTLSVCLYVCNSFWKAVYSISYTFYLLIKYEIFYLKNKNTLFLKKFKNRLCFDINLDFLQSFFFEFLNFFEFLFLIF